MHSMILSASSLLCVLVVASSVAADEPQNDPAPATGAPVPTAKAKAGAAVSMPVYDEEADPRQLIDTAVREAARNNRRALIVFGGNWCSWCIKLHNLFHQDEEIGNLLGFEYATAWVDTAQLKKDAALSKQFSEEIGKHGVPFLAVLDGEGKVLTLQDSGELEDGPKHDPAKVKAFLDQWVATPIDAEAVFADAQKHAAKTDKLVFVQCSTPFCGWCRRLEDFFHDQAAILDLDYVPVKIDIARMKNGREVAERIGFKEGGVPWSAIVDAEGKVLVTSDGPQGNIGYPAAPEEIAYFLVMLTKTTRHMSGEQIAAIETALKKAAEKYLPPANAGAAAPTPQRARQ